MRHIAYRILFALVLIAAIAGIALLAYNAGASQQAVINNQAPASQGSSQVYPTYGFPLWWTFPFLGFGFFGLLALFFLLSVAFGAARRMVWGPRFGWHRMHHRFGQWSDENCKEGVPPMFAEMHRRMHAAEENQPSGEAPQNKD